MRILAFMYVYNEVDILLWSMKHLIEQGINLHIMDNWSDDGSYELALSFQKENPKSVVVERYPQHGPKDTACWYDMLKNIERLSLKENYDWFIHYDADEIRRSPVQDESLVGFIKRMDSAGYNAIDHKVEVYKQVHDYDGKEHPEAVFKNVLEDHIDQYNGQIKCWKKQSVRVDLAESGGHKVEFKGIKIAEERIILKHYPLRGDKQVAKKLESRAKRWASSDRAKGWHVQYKQDVIVTLSKYRDIFDRLSASIELHESPTIRKIVVTSGGLQIENPNWEVIQGVEPFIYSRNCNLAFDKLHGQDILLTNDDCEWTSPAFNILKELSIKHKVGILSPQIDGGVGNDLQRVQQNRKEVYKSSHRLAFVCVYIPWRTRCIVGNLDEKFVGYGGDDVDYCRRVQAAGLELYVTPKVVVKHGYNDFGQSTSFLREMTLEQRNASMIEMDQKQPVSKIRPRRVSTGKVLNRKILQALRGQKR